jgi:hypothetical protein
MMDSKAEIYDLLYNIVGEGGCAGACSTSELYEENGEWKLFLCGFMEPWSLGSNLEEVKQNLQEFADAGFGLGAGVD